MKAGRLQMVIARIKTWCIRNIIFHKCLNDTYRVGLEFVIFRDFRLFGETSDNRRVAVFGVAEVLEVAV